MSRTLYIYNAFIKYNNQYPSVDVTQFINAVYSLSSQDRYVENSYGAYSLIDMLQSTSNPNNNPIDRLIGIASYRDKKPFAGNRGTDTINENNYGCF